ncbi:MAG: glycosyltransferase family 2 protein [Actinomycetota bacterium]
MIIVLIAAYNEELGLSELLPRLPRLVNDHAVEVLVVSDGSTDGTVDVAMENGCRTIEIEDNRGKGAALKTGLEAIRGEAYDVVVLMDADGQHDPAQLPAITAEVLSGTADLVIGSRYKQRSGRGNAPWNRYVVRCATRGLLDVILSAKVTDPFCGYRAISPDAARCIRLQGDRYESELEMLFCAERAGLRVAEIPIPKIYGPNTSKMAVRHGAVLGRLDVVARYAYTIVRETALLVSDPIAKRKNTVSR